MQTKPIFRCGGSAAVAWTTPWSRKFFLQSCHMLFRYSTAWMESDIHIFYVRNFCHHRCHFSTTSVPHVWFHILTLKSIFMRGTKLKFDSWRWEFGLKMILKAIFVAFWKTSESWYPAAASKVPSMHPVVLEKVPTHPKHPGCSDQSVCLQQQLQCLTTDQTNWRLDNKLTIDDPGGERWHQVGERSEGIGMQHISWAGITGNLHR